MKIEIELTSKIVRLLTKKQVKEALVKYLDDLSEEDLQEILFNFITGKIPDSKRNDDFNEFINNNTAEVTTDEIIVPNASEGAKTEEKEKEEEVKQEEYKEVPLTQEIFDEIFAAYKKGQKLLKLSRIYQVNYNTLYQKIRTYLKNQKKPLRFGAVEKKSEPIKKKEIIEEEIIEPVETEVDDDNMIGFDEDKELNDSDIIIENEEIENNNENDEDDVLIDRPIFDQKENNDDDDDSEPAFTDEKVKKKNDSLDELRKRNFIPRKIFDVILDARHSKNVKIEELAEFTHISSDIISKIFKIVDNG
jgi:hypothetical protein